MRGLRRTFVALTLTAAALIGSQAVAARLPDWARQLADAAPAVPEGLAEHPSRVLFSETVLSVEPDGKFRIRQRRATQAQSRTADEVGIGYFRFDDRTRIVNSRGWHLPTEGKAKKNRGGALDLLTDDAFLTDEMSRFIGVDGIEKGSLVFFEFEAIDEPYELGYQSMFYEGAPTDVMRFVVRVPPGWSVEHAFLREDGPEPDVSDGQWVWEIRDLEIFEEESLGESPLDLAPLLVVGFLPPADLSVEPASHPDWPSVAGWFEELARGRDDVTPEIESVAAGLLADPDADFFERVRLSGIYVRDRVRYVAKEIGVEGYQPRPASQVLENLYGDCKDKGTLLRALLRAAGHDSYPILINTSLPETVSDRVPSLRAFNHFVVGVPIPGGLPVPASFRSALIDAGDLGTLLVVDTTDEYGSIGWLRGYLGGKNALVVAGSESRLVWLPDGDPGAHRVEKRLDAEIAADLSVALRLEVKRYGDPAARSRYFHRQSVQDYREAAEKKLTDLWPASRLDALEVVEETDDGSFVETWTVSLDAPKDPEHAELLQVFPGALDTLRRVTLRRREVPVRYRHAVTLRYESEIRGVHQGVGVPPGEADRGEGWSVNAELSQETDVLKANWEMTLSRLFFSPDEFDELKRVWRSARRAAAAGIPRSP